MTLREAYLKVKAHIETDELWKKEGESRLESCSDYGDRWGFCFVPKDYNYEDESTWFGGGGDITVNKQTGEMGALVMHIDADVIATGKPISIEQFFERAAVA